MIEALLILLIILWCILFIGILLSWTDSIKEWAIKIDEKKEKIESNDISAQLFTECNILIGQKLRWLHDQCLMGIGDYQKESTHIRISPIEPNLFEVSFKGNPIARMWIKSDWEGVKINVVKI